MELWILVLGAGSILLAFQWWRQRQPRRCPHCGQPEVEELDREVDEVSFHERMGGLAGANIEASIYVNVRFHCLSCGRVWVERQKG